MNERCKKITALPAMLLLWILTGCGDTAVDTQSGTLHGRAVAFAKPDSVWDLDWQKVKKKIAAEDSVSLEFFTRGERGGEEQMLYDIRRGRAHMGGLSLQGLASTVPELNIAMAPYVFSSVAEVDYVYDHYLFDLFDELFAAKNLKLVQWTEVGWSGIFSRVPIRLPEDAKGVRLRGSPNPATQLFLDAIGADSIPLGSSDMVPSLQTGLIEGGVSAVIFHYFVTRRYAEYVTMSEHSYDTGAVVVNKKWFEGATPQQQQILQESWGGADAPRRAVRSLVSGAIAEMRDEGILIQDLTAAEQTTWREATAHIIPQLIEEIGGASQQVYDAIVAGRKAYAEHKASQSAALTAAHSATGEPH